MQMKKSFFLLYSLQIFRIWKGESKRIRKGRNQGRLSLLILSVNILQCNERHCNCDYDISSRSTGDCQPFPLAKHSVRIPPVVAFVANFCFFPSIFELRAKHASLIRCNEPWLQTRACLSFLTLKLVGRPASRSFLSAIVSALRKSSERKVDRFRHASGDDDAMASSRTRYVT
jgi:hypothetical protein